MISTYIQYPSSLNKDIPELKDLREEWAIIYTSYEIMKDKYSKAGDILLKAIREAKEGLVKNIKFIYSLEIRKYNKHRHDFSRDDEKIDMFIVKREVDVESIPSVLLEDKKLQEVLYSYPFEIINNVIVPRYCGGLYKIVTPMHLTTGQAQCIMELVIPEGVFDLPNRSI